MLDDGKLGKITSVYVVYNIYHPEEVRFLWLALTLTVVRPLVALRSGHIISSGGVSRTVQDY